MKFLESFGLNKAHRGGENHPINHPMRIDSALASIVAIRKQLEYAEEALQKSKRIISNAKTAACPFCGCIVLEIDGKEAPDDLR